MTLTLVHTQSIPVITPPDVQAQAESEARVAAGLRRRKAQPVSWQRHVAVQPDGIVWPELGVHTPLGLVVAATVAATLATLIGIVGLVSL